MKMSVSSSDQNKILPEAILNLRDRLKHGQNVAKILESQIDTAQQNISLLQGQVRLATETILSLKKHFQDTENILEQLMSNDQNAFELDLKDSEQENQIKHVLSSNVDSTTRSPLSSDQNTSDKLSDDKSEQNKSPYAQQLRQVLDVLTDEDISSSRLSKVASLHHHHDHHHDHHHENKDNAGECSSSLNRRNMISKCDCGSSSCSNSGESFCHPRRSNEEFGHSSKHKEIHHHSRHITMSPNPYERKELNSRPKSPPFSHCTGPCCTNNDMGGEYNRPVHFVAMHSPPLKSNENIPPSSTHILERRHHSSHCMRDSRPYVAYMPYGSRSYHMVDGAVSPGDLHLSPPSSSRKRHIPLMPGEEPPHLKYTKVKRIDGSKLTAQKVLHDFTKRRFCPYNPRFDLDLLIVPPPIPAMDLVKSNFIRVQKSEQRQPLQEKNVVKESSNLDFYQNLAKQSANLSESGLNDNLNGECFGKDGTIVIMSGEKKGACAEPFVLDEHANDIPMLKEENSPGVSIQNPTTMVMKNKVFSASIYPSAGSRLKIMPPIKEEFSPSPNSNDSSEMKSKLEDHINKLRNENNLKYENDTNNNGSAFRVAAAEQNIWKEDAVQQIVLNTTS